jgi:predicted O-methyltransferase YrrM
LLEAAKRIDGRVFSIDVEPCSEANAHVQSFGLSSHWNFLHGNALSFAPPAFPDQLDLLFIDTFHLYSQTVRELNHFEPYLAPKSWIVLHDAVTFPGVSRAVNEFMMKYPRRFRFYPYIHQHGLLLLRSH